MNKEGMNVEHRTSNVQLGRNEVEESKSRRDQKSKSHRVEKRKRMNIERPMSDVEPEQKTKVKKTNKITWIMVGDRELRKRGMLDSSVDPDLVVAYAAGIDMDALKLKLDPTTKMNMAKNVPQGGLVVMLVDSESGFVIWVGV
jgi:hypothetical protein